ncbi:type II secretion system protein [Candidatus Omnitrophota bacterium]
MPNLSKMISKRKDGYTLIEVAAMIVIVAIPVIAITSTMIFGLRSLDKQVDDTQLLFETQTFWFFLN